MPLGPLSMKRLAECRQDIQDLILEVAADIDAGALAPLITDMTVLCGFRGQLEQDAAVARGASKTPWPRSKHNRKPALAVDIAAHPYVSTDELRANVLRGYVVAKARQRGMRLKIISWDAPHVEPLP